MSLVAGALSQMNEVNNLDKWVSHHLSGNEKYIDLFAHNSDPFLYRIKICDRKRILCGNLGGSHQSKAEVRLYV